MFRSKYSARGEYRERESQRTKDSATLATRFPELKTLTADITYFAQDGRTKGTQFHNEVNVAFAKSVFRFDCLNHECVGGDFDLSEVIARAVARQEASVTGEVQCQGWLSKTTIDRIRCHQLLRYTLSLGY